jgi:hypothetical protein
MSPASSAATPAGVSNAPLPVPRTVELAIARAQTTPLACVGAATGAHLEGLDAMVPGVGHVHFATVIHCHTAQPVKFTAPGAERPPLTDVGRVGRRCDESLVPPPADRLAARRTSERCPVPAERLKERLADRLDATSSGTNVGAPRRIIQRIRNE